MDNMKILKRAWTILWNYRILWIFGFILALTVGGATTGRIGSNSGYRYNSDQNFQQNFPDINWSDKTFSDPQAFMETLKTAGNSLIEVIGAQPETGTLIGFFIAFIVLMTLFGIGVKILGYVAETAVIRLVDEHETSSLKASLKQGFRYGWSRTSWRLFLIDLLLVTLPSLVFLSILVLLVWSGISIAIRIGTNQGWVFSIVFLAGLVFLTILLFSLYFMIVSLLRNFFVRACAIEQVGVRSALRKGYSLVRDNWKEVGLFWLILIGLGIGWSIASILLVILLIPVFVVSFVLAALVASVPGLLVGGFSSIFLSGYWPVVVGAVFGLPLFLVLAGSPILFFEGLVQVFRSTSWTLVYRELKSIKPEHKTGDEFGLVENAT